MKLEGDVDRAKVVRISRQQSPVLNMVDQQLLKTVTCFGCVGSLITNGARCTLDLKYSTSIAKTAFSKKKAIFTSKLDINLTL